MSTCRNCDARLSGLYCAQCGQKAGPVNPSLRDLLGDLAHELLNVDGKVFTSARLLLTRPGFLTREHFLGRRGRYMSPIRLYLIFSVASFGIAALIGGEPIFEPDEELEVGALGQMLGLREMTAPEANAFIQRASNDWVPRVMFVLVPIAALLVQLVTRRSGRKYPQHLYFALHVHAAYFAVLAATQILDLLEINALSNALAILRSLFLLIYLAIAFRTAYDGTWPRTLGRTAFVFVTYMFAVTTALVLSAIVVSRLQR